MIIGFHLTWTTYGHWFPNDPRGSWSEEVWKPELLRIRPLDDGRKVTRARLVPRPELQRFLDRARSELRWKVVYLNGKEIDSVGEAFRDIAHTIDLQVRACSNLHNHVHLVVDRHQHSYERIVDRLKGKSSMAVRRTRALPTTRNRRDRVPIWTQGYWCRYINNVEQLECAVNYVENNPIRDGLQEQHWEFVRSSAASR